VHGKLLVRATQDRNKVVLESLKGPLRSILAIYVERDKLEIYALLSNSTFQGNGSFIVHFLE
jgi:hypothetical protein